MKARLLNAVWRMACGREAGAFARACRSVEQAQANVLREIIRDNQETVFGRQREFAGITTVREFQERVPVADYSDHAEYVARIAAGENNVLTAEPVELLQPTSGTTGGEKLIPLTRSLRRQFQRGVATWTADLLHRYPEAGAGRAYWSISPALPARRTAGGLKIGFDDDAAYLSRAEQWALRHLLVMPPSAAKVCDAAAFRHVTRYRLLAARDLSLISIWSPTFLTALLGTLPAEWEAVCEDLHAGKFHHLDLPANLAAQLALGPMPRRAAELRRIFAGGGTAGEKFRQAWPKLALISAWADAAAARYVPALRALFPGVAIQPKGLLATEAIVSVPLAERAGAALALRSHFFEFQEETGAIRLAHELSPGGRYAVIVTTGGGLYRYSLRDRVQVSGFIDGCPLLNFLGKADNVSDLVGEKLAEEHVRRVLARELDSAGFAMVAPEDGGYCLYVAAACGEAAVRRIEAGLMENPHYAYAVRMGQLHPLDVVEVGAEAWARYEEACVEGGMRRGNIKPVVLERRGGWRSVLGERVAPGVTGRARSQKVDSGAA